MKLYIIHFILLCSFIEVNAQTGVITGVITDERSNPIPDANVFVRSVDKGTSTDRFGKFTIRNIPTGSYDVNISSIGFRGDTIHVDLQDKAVVDISTSLTATALVLSDVVVKHNLTQQTHTISQVDIRLRPINTSQDILRMIPGLFIAQHAGGGKAEQIFLRGFDIDHGTDINLEVDGMPVNMVSHAHGQGYSDLHFVIPELVNMADFNKGPYYANKGNFTTAGYVSFNTRNTIENNIVKIEAGRFGTLRNVNAIRLFTSSSDERKSDAYIASEFFRTSGFFESDQNFNRINLMGKFNSYWNNNETLTVGFSTFNSEWDASGQIPQRAVDNGLITRFGAIDDTEGGETSRTNFFVNHTKVLNRSLVENQLYYSKYDFSLVSNFTFFLNDPVNGDQITQTESRNIYGYKGNFTNHSAVAGLDLKSEAGIGFRHDEINDIHLASTRSRKELLESKARGDIEETNLFAFLSETLNLTPAISLNTAIRIDNFSFNYVDALASDYKKLNVTKSIFSPKLNLSYNVSEKINLFIKSGLGFHSNDTRVVVAQAGREILPRAYGVDVGSTFKINQNIIANATLWMLDLDQEFVYVGDEGIVEPSGKTNRKGIDFSVRAQLAKWLFLDSDINVTKPVVKDEPEDNNYIPLAPTFSTIGGLTIKLDNGLNGSVRYRYLDDRPANEDNSTIAEGYFLTDMVIKYSRQKFELSLSAENIFNASWKEAQFETESRLFDEAEPVSEIHFTPGTPFFVKAGIAFFF